jgi:hypothetical protein
MIALVYTLALLTGTWSCVTTGGSNVTATFAVAPNGEVLEHQTWRGGGGQGGSWDQTFDFANGSWTVENLGSNGWVFNGVSSGFDGDVIEFVGLQKEGTVTVPMRERYTIFDGAHTFQHVWERLAKGVWQPTSYADCKQAESRANG